jgi:hypothetical protein
MASKVDRLRCDDCGIEIPVAAIVGLNGTEAMTAEEYLDRAAHCRLRDFLQGLHRRSRDRLGNETLATAEL